MKPKHIPMLFSTAMVEAQLDGRKTETRRVFKLPKRLKHLELQSATRIFQTGDFDLRFTDGSHWGMPAPYRRGDLIWVKEAWRTFGALDEWPPGDLLVKHPNLQINWKARGGSTGLSEDPGGRWRASMHLPKVASRLTLWVKGFGIERLHDITQEGAIAEGCPGLYSPAHPDVGVTDGQTPVDEYAELWNSINGPEAWDKNPWVTVTKFEVIEQNILDVDF